MKPGEVWKEKIEDSGKASPVVIDSLDSDMVYFWEIVEEGLLGYAGFRGAGGVAYKQTREEFLENYEKVY